MVLKLLSRSKLWIWSEVANISYCTLRIQLYDEHANSTQMKETFAINPRFIVSGRKIKKARPLDIPTISLRVLACYEISNCFSGATKNRIKCANNNQTKYNCHEENTFSIPRHLLKKSFKIMSTNITVTMQWVNSIINGNKMHSTWERGGWIGFQPLRTGLNQTSAQKRALVRRRST